MMGRSDEAAMRRSARAASARSFSAGRVLWNGVDAMRVRQGLMAALLAAFMSLFVLTSAVDAATCAVEPANHSAAGVSVNPTDTDRGDAGDDHAICSHGHCHHGGAPLPSAPQPGAAAALATMKPLLPSSEPFTSRTPSGLKRPPRA
jgi:hypothetical protein